MYLLALIDYMFLIFIIDECVDFTEKKSYQEAKNYISSWFFDRNLSYRKLPLRKRHTYGFSLSLTSFSIFSSSVDTLHPIILLLHTAD